MLRVIEVANKLGVSKVTIYKKISKLPEIKPFIVQKQKITYIKDEGIEIIKNDLLKFKVGNTKLVLDEKWNEDIENLRGYLNFLENQKKIKQNQINLKNIQIEKTKYLINLNKRRLELLEMRYEN
ncbi:MAG: hypothetical protein U9N10_09995 [Bacillota bacterium]|nr:hypothetical protein [Bacillota bacterium]